MNKKSIAELYRELPELVSKNVVSPDTAERLKKHYGPIEETSGTRTLLLVFGVFGVLLVGLGIILLIAHNWAQITRINRLALSVGLLVAAQLTAGLVLYFKQGQRVWLESAAALHMLVIGAVLALVGQTYHLTGDTDMFLLTWMLLSLPLIYLMRASSAAVMYIAGVTYWCTSVYPQPEKQFVWALLALVLPFYWRLIQLFRSANATAIATWVLNICLFISFASAFGNLLNKYSLLVYSALFTLNYLAGVQWFNSDPNQWRMPFKAVGLAGITVSTFMATFHSFWHYQKLETYTASVTELVLSIFLLLLVCWWNLLLSKQTGLKPLPFATAPLVIGSAYLAQHLDVSGIAATVILNAYMLLISLWVISTGTRYRRIGLVNVGMLMLALLVISRFLDMNFSFIVRGLVFVALGIGFLITNWLLIRRKPGGQDEK